MATRMARPRTVGARPRAHSGRKSSTIGRRAASIGYHHKLAGHEPPTNQEGVKVVLRGIRRTIGTARAGKAPATADLLMQMVALCPDSMIGRRERALLALGFDGAFRRSECGEAISLWWTMCRCTGHRRTRGAGEARCVGAGVPRLQPGP